RRAARRLRRAPAHDRRLHAPRGGDAAAGRGRRRRPRRARAAGRGRRHAAVPGDERRRARGRRRAVRRRAHRHRPPAARAHRPGDALRPARRRRRGPGAAPRPRARAGRPAGPVRPSHRARGRGRPERGDPMSAATAGPVVPAADAARPLPPPVWRTVRSLARTYAVVAAWFVAVVLVLWVGAVVVAMRFGPLGQSMVQFSRQGMTWFPFSIGVTVVAGYHAAHIAAGMTRRALGVGTLLTSVGNAVVLSAVIAGLFWVEGLLYAANGWQQAIIDEGWFPADAGDLLAILGWQTLVTTAAQVSGMLVAVVYQRTGPWWG